MSFKVEHMYRVVASTHSRYDHHRVYKFKDNPKDWHANGTIKVCCEDGKVEIKVFEHDTINVHTLEITSEDGKCKARLSEQLTPPQE
tara:strand:+ start:4437 stop:4697 length:261 start_codon:yes stop_codon:yes gene_type:complete